MKWLDALLDKAIERRLRKSQAPLGGWQPKQVACWDCNLTHSLPQDVRQALASAEGFFARHEGHQVNWFESPGVAGLWTSNSDYKQAHAASAAYTIDLNTLASSSNFTAGKAGTAINNTSNLYTDYLVGGRITSGTTMTVDTSIEVWLYASINDTPTYPDGITGTDAAKTITSVNVKKSLLKLVERMTLDVTSNQVNWFGPVGIAQHYGWIVPKYHGPFVTHNGGASLHATAGNHIINYTPCFFYDYLGHAVQAHIWHPCGARVPQPSSVSRMRWALDATGRGRT